MPGTEVQVGTAGSGCRSARRNANLLACNFLATEAVAEGVVHVRPVRGIDAPCSVGPSGDALRQSEDGV